MLQFEIKDVTAMQNALADFCTFLNECQVPQERIFDSRLVANELVANVLKHAGEVAWFTGGIKNGFIEVAVRSQNGFYPTRCNVCSDVYSEHGRGLFLVDRLCVERRLGDDGAIVVVLKMK